MSSPDPNKSMQAHDEARLQSALKQVEQGQASEWMSRAVRGAAVVITAPVASDYRLPSHFAKTMSSARLAKLRLLLGELWSYREGLVGLKEREAGVIYNGDAFTLLLRDEFTAWSVGHLEDRLSRGSRKDRGNPLRTHDRLNDEFLRWWVALTIHPGTGHSVALYQCGLHLRWLLFKRTIGRHVEFRADGAFRIAFPDAKNQAIAQAFLSSEDGARLTKETSVSATILTYATVSVPFESLPSDPLAELQCIVEDLLEIRGRLLRSYKMDPNIVAIGEGVYGFWDWASDHRAGLIYVGTKAGLLEQDANEARHVRAMEVGLDGLPIESMTPFVVHNNDATIRWTLGALRPIYQHLIAEWERIGRLPMLAEGPADELEVITMACETLIDSDEVSEPQSRVRVPAVRTQKLLSVLQRDFGCEVKRGKGSEITVYRPGGRIYILPAHKRNTHYPTWMVRALLKRVGISAHDFAAVVCKRIEHH